MNKSLKLGMSVIAGAVMLAGCVGQPHYQTQSPSQQYPSQSQQYPSQVRPTVQSYQSQSSYIGIVDRIELIRRDGGNNIAGTVIGGIVGGLIGHQIGGGSGKTAATVVGAVGGAYAGNLIEQRQRAPNESFRVSVSMDDRTYRTIDVDNITDLRTGDRVRLEGNSIYRY